MASEPAPAKFYGIYNCSHWDREPEVVLRMVVGKSERVRDTPLTEAQLLVIIVAAGHALDALRAYRAKQEAADAQ